MNVKPIKLIIGAPLIFDNLSDDQVILIDANFVNKKDLQFFCKKLTLINTIVWDKKDILKKWNIYSDSRFNGFENNNNNKINFPNLKLIDTTKITTKTLNQILILFQILTRKKLILIFILIKETLIKFY